jgi:acetyl-CoA acetyltransferase
MLRAAAIASGLGKTVLITHGESGRSGVGRTRSVVVSPASLAGQFEQPYGPMGPPTLSTIPVLRYMKTYGLSQEQLAMVSVVQREWSAKNPRATSRRRLPSRMCGIRGRSHTRSGYCSVAW